METDVKRMKLDTSNLTLIPPPPPPVDNSNETEEKETQPQCSGAKLNSEISPECIELPPSLSSLNSEPVPTGKLRIPKEPHPESPSIATNVSQTLSSNEIITNTPKTEAPNAAAKPDSGTPTQPQTASDPKTIIPMPIQSIPPLTVGGPPSVIEGHTSTVGPPIQGGGAPETNPSSYPKLLPPPQRPPLLHLRLPHPPFPGPRMPPRLSMGPRPEMMLPPVPPGIPSDLWEWFFNSDEDKDGRITAGEVQRLLLKGKWSPFKEETCKMMLDMIDIDKIGTIDAYQMTSLWNSLLDWKNIFDELDTEKRGCLNASQMFKALEKFGYRLSSEFCDAVVDRFASDNDEKGEDPVLCFDDFIQTRVMLKTLTESFQVFDSAKAGVIDLHYEQFLEMVLTNAL